MERRLCRRAMRVPLRLWSVSRRVDEGVTTLTPHRSGCAALLHPVPHERASLTAAMPRHSGRLSTVVSLTGLQGAVSLPVSRQWVSPTTPPFPSTSILRFESYQAALSSL